MRKILIGSLQIIVMDVYDIEESGKLTKVNHKPVNEEKDIDIVIESHPDVIEPDLRIIGRQVVTNTGKFVDVMAIDKDANVVIIEDKKSKVPREVIAQILDYAVWAETLKDHQLNKIAKENVKLYGHTTLAKMFEEWTGDDNPDWNENQKLYVVGEEIDNETKDMLSYLHRKGIQIFAKTLKFHERDDGKRQLIVDPIVVAKEKKQHKGKTTKRTEQDHINKGDNNCLEIYNIIKKQTLDLGDDVDINVVHSYVGFRRNSRGGRIFLSIKFRQNTLRVILYAGRTGNGLDDPNNMTEDHSNKVNRVITKFGNKEEIPELMRIIKQSYDLGAKVSN